MKKLLLLMMAAIALGLTVRAADGDTFIIDNLKYTVLSEADRTVSIFAMNQEAHIGHLEIPRSATNNGVTYSVTEISRYGFSRCYNLTSVTIPNTVTTISEYAFRNCSGLTSISIPNSVITIGWYAFGECTGLTSITIPNSVTSIETGAFSMCSSLASVIIPNSVTAIGEGAFEECTGLVSMNLPNSVISIGDRAFAFCYKLTAVNLSSSVTSIGHAAFMDCRSLISVIIPASVTTLGINVFLSCSSLTTIMVDEGNESYMSIDNVVYTKDGKTILIVLAEREGEFVIPNTVTTIGEYAFVQCGKLTSVTIPRSVTEIGANAFKWCESLKMIHALPGTPPAVGLEAFYGVPTAAVVFVPKGTRGAYAAAEGWTYFTDFRETDESGIDRVAANGAEAAAEYFNLNGQRVNASALIPGIYMKRSGGRSSKVLVTR